ncbi:MAG: flagellar biosynthetic protein FliR [Burkholderiales bacterium PBB4]|nr:MAG: flagellar biosynthetic protein FliR [Burkholderiales bacterium PBB4]
MITFSEAQIYAWVTPIFWPFLRVLALFTAAPIFSSRALPVRARVALAFLIAVACQPGLPVMPIVGFSDAGAFEAVAQQVVVGLTIGFSIRVVFASMELAGEVVGFQMGLNFAAFFDPSMNSQSSALGRFFGQMAALLFVVLNGHVLVLVAVCRSFEAFPVGGSSLGPLNALQLYKLGSDLFASGLWIALPMVAMLMFVNLALGVISRVAPQMNIFAVGFPITLAVGLIGVALTLPLFEGPFVALMERTLSLF